MTVIHLDQAVAARLPTLRFPSVSIGENRQNRKAEENPPMVDAARRSSRHIHFASGAVSCAKYRSTQSALSRLNILGAELESGENQLWQTGPNSQRQHPHVHVFP